MAQTAVALTVVFLLSIFVTAFPQATRLFSEAAEADQPPANHSAAMARLRDAVGREVATALLTEERDGLRLQMEVHGLAPGEHGLHIHRVARCDPPDFFTAQEHVNPTARQHGLSNPTGPHAGDLPSLLVQADGRTAYDALNPRLTLRFGSPASLFDQDGSALVIHARPDDQRSDPDGGSGAGIACGVIIVP